MSKELDIIEDNHYVHIKFKMFSDMQNKLKALEIIKKKNVDVGWVKVSVMLAAKMLSTKPNWTIEPYIYYNTARPNNERLTEEEFDLLKEVLL